MHKKETKLKKSSMHIKFNLKELSANWTINIILVRYSKKRPNKFKAKYHKSNGKQQEHSLQSYENLINRTKRKYKI